MTPQIILVMRGISKSYPGVRALSGVDLDLQAGEVHALVGENGAGKSTLMKILAGATNKDSGTIVLRGQPVEITSPFQAQNLGIGIIHQERSLIPYLTGAQNILLGHEPFRRSSGLIRRHDLYRRAAEIMAEVGPEVPLSVPVKQLSAAQQQLIEIGKAISLQADIIIMDEPTSTLTDTETARLFAVIESLKEKRKAVIYISHRLKEIFTVADRITVLRDGRKIDTVSRKDATHDKVVSMMVGRNIDTSSTRSGNQAGSGPVVLRAENLTRRGAFRDISFELHAGEVLGLGGLVGAGRTEIIRALFGADRLDYGKVYVDGKPAAIKSPENAIAHGMGLVPEDRKEQGLVLGLSVRENLSLAALKRMTRLGVVDRAEQKNQCERFTRQLGIKTPGIEQKVRNLSGGNQQKVVIAKWLALDPKILILDEPTRGIDVAAKAEVHALIDNLAQKGIAIIVVSSELPELLRVCDRVLVLREGRLAAEVNRADATEEKIMHFATGGRSK